MAKTTSQKKVTVSGVTCRALVALPIGDSRYVRQLADGIVNTLSVQGWTTQLVDLLVKDIPWYDMKSFGGLVVWPIGFDDPRARKKVAKLESLIRRKYPVVFCEERCVGAGGDLCATDYEDLAYRLTRMLCERGHRQIVFASFIDPFGSAYGEQKDGYGRALEECNSDEVYPSLIHLVENSEVYDADLLLAMARCESATAFYCMSPNVAQRVERQLIELGYSVGGEIELASADDESFTEEWGTPLLRVKRPAYDIGVAAAECLLARAANPESAFQERRFKAGPVITGTTGNTIERPRTRFMTRL